jgi:hypothetical protein
MAYVQKKAPGHYTVWIGDLYLVFKTERDAQRFCDAEARAKKRSWHEEG